MPGYQAYQGTQTLAKTKGVAHAANTSTAHQPRHPPGKFRKHKHRADRRKQIKKILDEIGLGIGHSLY